MKQLLATAAIVAVVVLTAAAYGGGRWIGSLIDVGFDHGRAVLVDGGGDEGVGRARAEAEAAFRAEAQARRAAMEASRAAAERRALEGVWADATCVDWSELSAERQLHVIEELVAHLLEEVRIAQQLGADATYPEIAVAAQSSLSKVCEGAGPMHRLVDIVDQLYDSDD